MAGRGDNNKSGSAGQGSSNQSSQGFGQAADRGKSNHGEQTGNKPSQPEEKNERAVLKSRSKSGSQGGLISTLSGEGLFLGNGPLFKTKTT